MRWHDCRPAKGRWTAELGALLLTAALSPALATAKPAQVVNAVGPDKHGVTGMVLVGQSGQLYRPRPGGGWGRDEAGGVASDVVGAARRKDGTIFVIAAGRAPVYAFVGGSWQRYSVGERRPAVANTRSGTAVMAIGRQILRFDGQRWVRTGTAPGRLRAIWLGGNRAYVITEAGQLLRSNGRSWAPIAHKLADGDQLAWLVGVAGQLLVGITDAGHLVRVGAKSAELIKLPAELQGTTITAGGEGHKGEVILVGHRQTATGREQVALAVRTRQVRLVDHLPALRDGDRYSLVAMDSKGALLVASYDGQVHIRGGEGTWRQEPLTTEVARAAANPAAAKPARTR
jgi:hypothetical protein